MLWTMRDVDKNKQYVDQIWMFEEKGTCLNKEVIIMAEKYNSDFIAIV